MSDTLRLLLALLDIAPELERLLGTKWTQFRDALLVLAGRVDHGDDATATGRDLDAVLDELMMGAPPEAQDLLRRVMQQALAEEAEEPVTRRAGDIRVPDRNQLPAGEIKDIGGVVEIPVFYATDRARGGDTKPKNYYIGKKGSPTFGIAHVSVPLPPKRDLGELTGPSWWRLQFKPHPAKHVILTDVQSLGRDSFINELRDSFSSTDARDALIFVHGYNVSFEDAARRAAQISVDLKFAGRTLLYSWASAADPKRYFADEDTIDWSRKYFEEFLRLALTEIGACEVHVIAHSMGNRALMNTLEHFDPGALPDGSATLCQVIFAAPDIGRDKFIQLAEIFPGRARRYTLYASSRDIALKASKALHGYPRAGEAGESLLVVEGVDTIDASLADTSLIGLHHSYFGSKRSILRDIFELIAQGLEPDKRFEIQAAGGAEQKYWSYRT